MSETDEYEAGYRDGVRGVISAIRHFRRRMSATRPDRLAGRDIVMADALAEGMIEALEDHLAQARVPRRSA